MKLIHNIINRDKEQITLKKILQSGYLKSSSKTKNKSYGVSLKCNYFNIHLKDIRYKYGISLVFNKNILLMRYFYICLNQNYSRCQDDLYRFYFKNFLELSKFKKKIMPQILSNVTLYMNRYVEYTDDFIDLRKRFKIKKIDKNKNMDRYSNMYAFSHEILVCENISLADYLEEIIFDNGVIPDEEIINLLKEKYPNVKINIMAGAKKIAN